MVSSRGKAAADTEASKHTRRSSSELKTETIVDTELTNDNETKSLKQLSKNPSHVQLHIPTQELPAGPSPVTSNKTSSAQEPKKKNEKLYCICKGIDNGTPMIKCEGPCKNWYHFSCMDLSDDVGGEIEKYYCPECESKTGFKTVMDFEGEDAFIKPAVTKPSAGPRKLPSRRRKSLISLSDFNDSDEEMVDDGGSEDDYVDEPAKPRKKIQRQLSHSSERDLSDEASDGEAGAEHRKKSRSGRLKRLKKGMASLVVSPTTQMATSSTSNLKRRGSSAQHLNAPKRAKTAEGAQDDAIRKYCLSKLEEFIRPMFKECRIKEEPSVSDDKVIEDTGTEKDPEGQPPESEEVKAKDPENSSEKIRTDKEEEEEAKLEQKVKDFVTELEKCMMETYAEPDKSGKPSAGAKYKERFRMLQFNLPKVDRLALRKGIVTGKITPAQLNVMSSTDLADEQTKHDIEVAEKESLAHSILQKITAPLAKMTHKGYEAIEDVSGTRSNIEAVREEEEQRMEMEKQQRERRARLRVLAQENPTLGIDSSFSPVDIPPNSAAYATSPTSENPQDAWGNVPSTPSYPGRATVVNRPAVRPLFIPMAPVEATSEDGGLSLADLINIDDDAPTIQEPQADPQQRMNEQLSTESMQSPVVSSPSGPSPFAVSKPAESPARAAFDLSALWGQGNINKTRDEENDGVPADDDENTKHQGEDDMDVDSPGNVEDHELDAILQQDVTAAPLINEHELEPLPSNKVDLDSLPTVWAGRVYMPTEGPEDLATEVVCRQIAGNTLDPNSGYWQILFPSPETRIDGRVPTQSSTQYLINTRMNSSREIIAIVMTPQPDKAEKFAEVIDFFTKKDRHALVFPWGTRPKPDAPGRELYLIPLHKDEAIPEYIELLDNHLLPRDRDSDILLGVFVLNRGKLNATLLPHIPSTTTSYLNNIPPPPGIMNLTPPPPVPTYPPQIMPPFPPTLPKADPPSFAGSSLTQSQISLMLQQLSQSTPLVSSVPMGPPGSQTTPGPPQTNYLPNNAPTYPPYPPPYQQPPLPNQQSYSPPPFQDQGPSDRYYKEYNNNGSGDDYQRPYNREQRGRGSGRSRYNNHNGERGRRGGRGRGKSFHHDDNGRGGRFREHPLDRGWVNRGRDEDSPAQDWRPRE